MVNQSNQNFLRFSDYFNLGKSQAELDFVDIPLNTDILLFVDPYPFIHEKDEWFIECNNLVVSYFQLVIDTIHKGDEREAINLLMHFNEPNDAHLGFSRKQPSGCGVGVTQANFLYNRLKNSKAVATGKIKHLADCELVIPGISNDKISDMTINIIKNKLLEYTKIQCDLLGIATENVASGMYWDSNGNRWLNRYASLPVYQGKRIILVPKLSVRYSMAVDHQEYYRHFVLNYLQVEHLDAGSALVTLLKSGERRVYKTDLIKEYPLTKEFLFEFSEEHPDVLEEYKEYLREKKLGYLSDEDIEEMQKAPKSIDISYLINKLDQILPGDENSNKYHDFIVGALEAIFAPNIRKPVKEQEIHEGRKRIDISFTNGGTGFFYNLAFLHSIHCPYIFFECKNYSSDPKNPEIDQITGRFSRTRGNFGIIVCRNVSNRKLLISRCKDILNDNRGYVLVLEDEDIKIMLSMRANEDLEGINNYMEEKLKQLIM